MLKKIVQVSSLSLMVALSAALPPSPARKISPPRWVLSPRIWLSQRSNSAHMDTSPCTGTMGSGSAPIARICAASESWKKGPALGRPGPLHARPQGIRHARDHAKPRFPKTVWRKTLKLSGSRRFLCTKAHTSRAERRPRPRVTLVQTERHFPWIRIASTAPPTRPKAR